MAIQETCRPGTDYTSSSVLLMVPCNACILKQNCTIKVSCFRHLGEIYDLLDTLYNRFDALTDEFPDVYKLETIGDAYMIVSCPPATV